MVVVVPLVLAERHPGMLLVDDQGAVEEFAADSSDKAFGDAPAVRGPAF
jgi:hypothetical protein